MSASENHKYRALLEESGFKEIRRGKHPIFSDGYSNVPMPTGKVKSRRNFLNFRSDIRRLIRKREEIIAKKREENAVTA